ELAELLGHPVHLFLYVKVREDWAEDPERYREMGLEFPKEWVAAYGQHHDRLMNWSDEGIVLSVRPHGETAAVVDRRTRQHGRHVGLVHGGRSRRMRPVLQSGNHVEATWKGRLAEHLGYFTTELRKGYAASVMEDPLALTGLTSLCALARLLPERDPHPEIFEVTLF